MLGNITAKATIWGIHDILPASWKNCFNSPLVILLLSSSAGTGGPLLHHHHLHPTRQLWDGGHLPGTESLSAP